MPWDGWIDSGGFVHEEGWKEEQPRVSNEWESYAISEGWCPHGTGLLPRDCVKCLTSEVERLREALEREWEYNHFEHCGREWPHPSGAFCGWPRPDVLHPDEKEDT